MTADEEVYVYEKYSLMGMTVMNVAGRISIICYVMEDVV